MSKPKQNPLSYLAIAGGTLLFYMCVIPLADAISTLAQAAISAKVSKIQYIVAKNQKEVENIAEKINNSDSIQAIGFQIENDEMEYEDEE